MLKKYCITEEEIAEIKIAKKKNKNINVNNRLKAILLYAEGMKCKKIAEKTDFGVSYISQLVGKYCNNGLSAIVDNHYKGNNRNLSFEEETELLEPFIEAAKAGQIVEVSEIKQAYEKKIGRALENNHGQIYYVLKRHGWRKVMPRSRHPKKASDEAIEASNKLDYIE